MYIRDVLKADSGPAGEQAVWGLASKVLKDEAAIAQYLTAEQCRPGLTKLVRIEGANLDHVRRSNIKAAALHD